MNSIRSAERILNWQSQFDRVDRWFARLAKGEAVSDIERLDFYLAFFMNCYAMRDWFIKSGVIAKSDIDELINADPSMRLCRDICNRAKHYTLTYPPSADAYFEIKREYDPFSSDTHWLVFAEGRKRDLYDLAAACRMFWKGFVESRNPHGAGHADGASGYCE